MRVSKNRVDAMSDEDPRVGPVPRGIDVLGARPLTLTRVAVVIAASIPLASGAFWLYLYALYGAYYGTFGVTLEQVGLTQSEILARASGRALLGVVFVGSPYLLVISCARATVNAGSKLPWVHGAHPPGKSIFHVSGWPAGARVPPRFINAACVILVAIGLLFFGLATQFDGAVLLFALLALTTVLIAVAVIGVDAWDRRPWWRRAVPYLRVVLVALALLGIAVVSYTSVGAARSAALETLGTSVPKDDSAGAVSIIERGWVALLTSPGTDVVEVRLKPVGEDVAGLCRADADVRYRRLGWTPDVLTLVEQRRATAMVSGEAAFSVISVPSDAYSVRTALQPGAVVVGPCF